MNKPRPLTPEEEQRMLDLIDQGLSRNAIAKELGRSHDLVSKVAAKNGRTFDRSQMAAATKARQLDAAARRARLSSDALTKAQAALDQMGQPAVLRQVTLKGEVVEFQIPVPTAQDQERLARAASMLAKSHLDLTAKDESSEVGRQRSLLGDLARAMGVQIDPAP